MLFLVAPIEGRESYRPRDHDPDDPVVVITTARSWGVPIARHGRDRSVFHDGDRVVVVGRDACDPAALAGLDHLLACARAEGTRVDVRDVARRQISTHQTARVDRNRLARSTDRRVPKHRRTGR